VSTRIGDYDTVEQLGVDELGTTYLANHVLLPRQVALRVGASSRSKAMQVLREACLLEALSHHGIPRVFECGMLPDKRPWTAFERIEGTSIAQLVKAEPLPAFEVVQLVRDVADVLHHAHGRGVVHRRIVSDAIVRCDGRSIGHVVRHWDRALTQDTRRVDLDPRDDVFALGVVAFRALTGTMPDVQTTAEAMASAPTDLTDLIDAMLGTEPASRPTSAEAGERARWLATTLEPLMTRPRWTPPRGLTDLPMLDAELRVRPQTE